MHRPGRAADTTIRCEQRTPPAIPAHSKATNGSAVVERCLKALGFISIGALPAKNDGNCCGGRWTPASRPVRQDLSLLIARPTDHSRPIQGHQSNGLGLRFPNRLHSPQTAQYSWRTAALSKSGGLRRSPSVRRPDLVFRKSKIPRREDKAESPSFHPSDCRL